ncbi:hypothetical protein [Pseudoduganella violacea]|uniref:Uncharacterized protein n=1 Tax=Pseudoduganella violacea TaxID=1715466 RepID=A0A7W5BEU3_9BURK|nr:hypothetical protein [Pseudoduganella violacea]MBB3121832.1 hypothetical protein [Pseudoduganella violacea]
METPRRPEHPPAGSDIAGAGQLWRPSSGYLLIALALAIGGLALLFFVWHWSGADAPDDAAPSVAASSAAPPSPTSMPASAPKPATPQGSAQKAASRTPEGNADPTPDLASYVARGEKPSMAEVIERLHARGVHTGLGAFSPPGTRPPLMGLAVPEDFELPKGYVRHHQATDDGQRIEAVLMFAPDFQLLNAAGQPVTMPKDRVVPPELAPPGLPIRRIVIPPPVDPARPGH